MAAYTSTDLINIRKAIKSGVRTVQIGDRSTTFRSLDEMEAIERKVAREVSGRTRRQYVVVPESGL